MSIATEITRLQGIKTDIRTALVTQGIAQASSHNMADFSADILAIQGGSEGVYITVKCDVEYQGYDIILSANESELYRKQCPSSPSITEVTFFVSSDDVTLPTTFTISNNHPDYSSVTQDVPASMYGWYEINLIAWNGELYDAGNEYSDVTGGWDIYGTSSNVTKNATDITVNWNSNWPISSYLITNNPIKTTGYTTLKMTQRTDNINNTNIVILDENHSVVKTAIGSQGTTGTVSIPISDYQGNYYIGLSGGAAKTSTLYKAWLE